jgi:hypothetical protein
MQVRMIIWKNQTSTRATFRLAFNTKLDCGIKMSNFITRIVILFRCF